MLRIHHPPEGEMTVSDFSVRVNGEETLPWFCRVSAMPAASEHSSVGQRPRY